MKIASLRVDGFGVLAGLEVDDLAPGLTVVAGPNEAGKSTLLDFLRGVLFGFPDRRRRDPFHEPLRGGRHGGAVTLLDSAERRWHLERHVGSRSPVLTAPDGTSAGLEELQRLLGCADDALFRSVFAFGLGELSAFDSLEREEIRELVFSAGILGAGRSATRASRVFESRRTPLVRPRQGEARANRLRARLAEVEAELRFARARAEGYPAAAEELAALLEELEVAREAADGVRRRSREVERLRECWAIAQDQRAAVAELASLGNGTCEELPEGAAADVRRLAAVLSGHLERQEKAAGLVASRSGIARELDAILADLGVPGGPEALRALDVGFATRDRVEHLAEEDHRLLADGRAADEAVAQATREAEEVVAAQAGLGDAPIRPESDLVEAARSLRELRSLLDERSRLEREAVAVRGEALLAAASGQRRRIGPQALIAGGLGALALLGAIVADLHHDTLATLTLLLLGLVGLGVPLLLGRATPDPVPTAGDRLEAHRARLDGRIEELAELLGLAADPAPGELELLAERLEAEREQWRHLVEAARAAAAARRRLDEAKRRLAARRAEREELVVRTSEEARRLGCAPGIRPAALVAVVDRLERATKLAEARERVDQELALLEEQLASYRSDLAAICAALGLPPAETESRTVAILEEHCEGRLERLRARRRLEERVGDAVEQLATRLGGGRDGERLRAELAGGEVLVWEEEARCLGEELRERVVAHEEQVKRVADAERRLAELATSSEVAELELERSSLDAELDGVLEEWLTLGAARTMLERTLAAYERDRQPAVIARATELFRTVTDGRYVRLVAREDPDNAARHGVTVIDASGSRVEAGDLSRGTAEQLYLCLRLAFAITFAERSASLPLVLDDVLVNFDPVRAAAVARTIGEVAREHQVIALTCHPHLVDCFATHAGGARIVELAASAH